MAVTIYGDVLVIVNLYLDFFLLWCVKKVLHLRRKNWRLLLGALAGALCALLALLQPPPALSLLWGAVSALLTAGAAFCPLKPRMFLRASLCLWAFSMGLAGFFLFVLRFLAPGRVALLGSVVYFDLSLPLLFFCTCGAYLVFLALRRLLPQDPSDRRFCTLLVEDGGRQAALFAKADTGNSLREPFSGLPVIVCQGERLKDLAPPGALQFLNTGGVGEGAEEGAEAASPNGLRLVPFDTLGGGGVLPAFRPQRVAVKETGQALSCFLALSPRPLSAGQYEAIYNPDQFT